MKFKTAYISSSFERRLDNHIVIAPSCSSLQLPAGLDQATVGVYVPKSELLYGDLVFFAADGKNVNHVGIYVGNGEFVHAPSTGNVVKNSSLISGYYQRTYFTARRVIR